jgi:ATP-dependent exoDNAse (exonuclease V) alpha subunit
MTVNKSQGQTIPNIGAYLPEPMFSRGQLYMVLSRAMARSNIKILALSAAEKDVNKGKGKGKGKAKKKATKDIFTKNIVYKEVLTP